MSETETFDEDLDDVGYEVKDELKIRKVLEKHTDWKFEFTKNDQYKYDLTIYEWGNEPQTREDQSVLGYVELERCRCDKDTSWVMGTIPDSWYYLSFLQRKVREFNWETHTWAGLKEDYDRTIYLKFNHAMTNCFAAPIEVIHRDGVNTKRSDGGYNSTYLKLDKDHPEVEYGIETCVSLIKDHLTDRDSGQSNLTDWGR